MSAEKTACYIGLMSGTSLDGIDAVLVDFANQSPELISAATQPIPTQLRQSLLALCDTGTNEIERMACADRLLGQLFADTVLALLDTSNITAASIQAIGSHGQTIRHLPNGTTPFTVQIGDPNTIAQQTGITTVADFRRRDLASGGQGAPLAPAFHAAMFHSSRCNRAILNIGGMANLTLLPAAACAPVTGFDTGPGNVLLDSWCQQQIQQPYDAQGEWARSGEIDEALLNQLLELPYFSESPPKSTGREQFNLQWLNQQLRSRSGFNLSDADIAATLTELTARSITDSLKDHQTDCGELFVCGGGAHNSYLLERLGKLLPASRVSTTEELGIAPDWIEATAFAWMAKRTLERNPANLPSVTGAREACLLGGVYYA